MIICWFLNNEVLSRLHYCLQCALQVYYSKPTFLLRLAIDFFLWFCVSHIMNLARVKTSKTRNKQYLIKFMIVFYLKIIAPIMSMLFQLHTYPPHNFNQPYLTVKYLQVNPNQTHKLNYKKIAHCTFHFLVHFMLISWCSFQATLWNATERSLAPNIALTK